jgi:ribosomal protein L9
MFDALRARKEKKELEEQQAREQAEWDAKQAAKTSKRDITKLIANIEKNEQQIIANAAAAKVKGKSVTCKCKAGQGGKLFGSVTAGNIADVVKEQLGVAIDKKKVSLSAEIKAFGAYTAELKFHPGISEKITVNVVEE